jgi:hypothetical protein
VHLSARLACLPEDELDKLFWMEMVLHGLDIGNCAYTWEDCYRWARMCVCEFQGQVASERLKGERSGVALGQLPPRHHPLARRLAGRRGGGGADARRPAAAWQGFPCPSSWT